MCHCTRPCFSRFGRGVSELGTRRDICYIEASRSPRMVLQRVEMYVHLQHGVRSSGGSVLVHFCHFLGCLARVSSFLGHFLFALDPQNLIFIHCLARHDTHAMVRACADDVGCFLSHPKHLVVVTSCFDNTTASTGLALGAPKCKIVPCYSRHSKALEFMLRKFLAECVP